MDARDPAGRWHVSLLCEVTVPDGPPTDAVIGLDAGAASLVALSIGERVTIPGTNAPTALAWRVPSGRWPARSAGR